jgi:hypothetical protein
VLTGDSVLIAEKTPATINSTQEKRKPKIAIFDT